jgi:hypothetical protein
MRGNFIFSFFYKFCFKLNSGLLSVSCPFKWILLPHAPVFRRATGLPVAVFSDYRGQLRAKPSSGITSIHCYMNRPLILLLGLLLLLSCRTPAYDPATYTSKRLVFGSGGGITGAVTTFALLPGGELFRDAPHDSTGFALLAEVEGAAARAAFRQARDLEAYQLDEPGNYYYFLAYHSKKTSYRHTWGRAGQTPPPEVQALYDYLMAMVKAQTAPER